MTHAFVIVFGGILGALGALLCVLGLLVLLVGFIDGWLKYQKQRAYQQNEWNNYEFPALFEPQPEPSLEQKSDEIESWWIPMDSWDQQHP